MSLDERLRRHLSDQAARTAVPPGPSAYQVQARSYDRLRRWFRAMGAGLAVAAACVLGVIVVSRPDDRPPPEVASPSTPTTLPPVVEAPPPTPPPTIPTASVVAGPVSVDEYVLQEASAFPEMVQVSSDDQGFVLADPVGASGWSFLRSDDGRQWTGVSSNLPSDLVAAPRARLGDQHVVFGGLRRGLSAPWSEQDVVAAVTDDLGQWNIVQLPVPLPTPRRMEDVAFFEGTAGDFVALGTLTVDFEALVWERLPAEIQADLVESLEGGAVYSQWVLVVQGERVAIELHRFATGADRVLFESTVAELGLGEFVAADGVRDDRRYVAWTLGADGLPEAAEARGLDLVTISGTGRVGDSVWALGTEADGAAALYRSRDGVRWSRVDSLDLVGVQEPLYLLAEPLRLTVYGVRDNLVMDWRSDDGEEWDQRVIWEHDQPIRSASAIRGALGEPAVTIAVSAGERAPTTVLATDDGGRNWRLVTLDPGAELLAATGDTLLVRQVGEPGDDRARPYLISRIELE
ncbi:MAG: hypothetical protein ACR2QE_20335 [Acidimicrobiales bacterium]